MIYLQTLLDEWLGAAKARVILPITDPYVVHHGALGSFATIYLPAGADGVDALLGRLRSVEGVDVALGKAEAARASSCRPTASATSSSSRRSTRCSAPAASGTISRA